MGTGHRFFICSWKLRTQFEEEILDILSLLKNSPISSFKGEPYTKSAGLASKTSLRLVLRPRSTVGIYSGHLGNHQMLRIVRHNDESVREGYIRNGGKEVKLFTSALKAFQCNNCKVMVQRKHLDDYFRGRSIRRLECGRTQLEVSEELGITQSIISRLWKRFQDDGNVSRCYSKGHPQVTTPNEDRYIWQLLPKETDGAQHQTCLVSSLQLPVRQFQGRLCTEA
ncbi:uncharacterized protein TNCV_482871 [Trichonephila clavipes]|uniref:Paired domain-containing protein n=1 Tax=Trichonephila clavipes TaxID=2585209 RepID=A0A8X6S8Q8_TRICX|nr:uncharacterized protein TNCV_482871 [Trichonephila clavipes]